MMLHLNILDFDILLPSCCHFCFSVFAIKSHLLIIADICDIFILRRKKSLKTKNHNGILTLCIIYYNLTKIFARITPLKYNDFFSPFICTIK